VRTRSKIRCCSCKGRIHEHEPDVVLQRLHSEERLYYHTRCASSAVAMLMLEPDVWITVHRYVDEEYRVEYRERGER